MLLKKPHDDGCRYVIRQVRHYLDGAAAVLCPDELLDVDLEDVLVDDREVRVVPKNVFFKDLHEIPVDLDRDDLACALTQMPRHRPDTGPDLEHAVVLRNARRIDDLLDDMTVDKEVLSELLAGHKVVFLQYSYRSCRFVI